MIFYEDTKLDDFLTHRRLAVLEAMEPAMMVHCYSTVDALESVMEKGQQELLAAGLPGHVRVALVFRDSRAIEVVKKRMAPGFDFPAWSDPDAWLQLYNVIDGLRARAKQYDPQFAPRYI